MASGSKVVFPYSSNESTPNRIEELKAFDDTKAGVKGLVDSGLLKVPNIFIRPSNELPNCNNSDSNSPNFQIPVIDLLHAIGEDGRRRGEVVDEIKCAAEKWGFFQVVNHGVASNVLDEMINGVIRFNEEDDEVKKEYYGRDRKRRVQFNSNFDLYQSKAAGWRDTLTYHMLNPDLVDPDEMPAASREITMEYTKHVTALGDTLFQLLSEALGLKPDYLKKMDCAESCVLVCHYYPACPEPELTIGAAKHTDPAFLTILLQDNIGGLQVLHQDHWVDVHPIPGALVINIGNFLQITSNDKLKSVEHRVLSNHVGPRISVACFLSRRFDMPTKPFGPIKELVSVESGPVYRDISMKEYLDHFYAEGLDGKSGLDIFKMSKV